MSNYWKDKKVLVTGGAGFIGSHVVNELVINGATVTVCVSPTTSLKKIETHLAKVMDKITIKKANLLSRRSTLAVGKGQDIILNFAALDGGKNFKTKNAKLLYTVNTQMGLNILESARKNNVERLLIISSIEIYPSSSVSPVTEDQAELETTKILSEGYPGAKRVIEREAKKYYAEYKLPIAIARLGNTYGPRDHMDNEKRRVIPTFILQALNNNDITLWGDGSQEVSFIHADDLVYNLLRLVEKYAVADPVNMVSSQYISLKDLALKIINLVGSTSKITFIKNVSVARKKRLFSSEKAKREIKFKEKITLKKGLKQTIESLHK